MIQREKREREEGDEIEGTRDRESYEREISISSRFAFRERKQREKESITFVWIRPTHFYATLYRKREKEIKAPKRCVLRCVDTTLSMIAAKNREMARRMGADFGYTRCDWVE